MCVSYLYGAVVGLRCDSLTKVACFRYTGLSRLSFFSLILIHDALVLHCELEKRSKKYIMRDDKCPARGGRAIRALPGVFSVSANYRL